MPSRPELSERLKQDCERFGLHPGQAEQFLYKRVSEAKARAYCPYSNFRVGACVATSDGHYFTGVNVENAAYPVGTCAERCAIGNAVNAGYTEFVAIAVSTDTTTPASPCGMCRQFIREFCAKGTPIFMFCGSPNEQGGESLIDYEVKTLEELLPMSFGPEDLTGMPKKRELPGKDEK